MEWLQKEIKGHVLVLRLNRPEKHNCLNAELLEALDTCFIEANINDNIRAVALFGNGKSFCAGADINRLAECDAVSGFNFARTGQAVMHRIAMLPKPAIVGLHGHVLGGGCELASAFHMRFAHKETVLGQPEVKLGVIPGYGGTQRLARLIGLSRAIDLCMSGRFVHADEAYRIGLVNEVCEDVEGRVFNYIESLLTLPIHAITGVLQSIQTGIELPISAALELEALHFAKTCGTYDKKEGVSAFLEKRKPHFKGA